MRTQTRRDHHSRETRHKESTGYPTPDHTHWIGTEERFLNCPRRSQRLRVAHRRGLVAVDVDGVETMRVREPLRLLPSCCPLRAIPVRARGCGVTEGLRIAVSGSNVVVSSQWGGTATNGPPPDTEGVLPCR